MKTLTLHVYLPIYINVYFYRAIMFYFKTIELGGLKFEISNTYIYIHRIKKDNNHISYRELRMCLVYHFCNLKDTYLNYTKCVYSTSVVRVGVHLIDV